MKRKRNNYFPQRAKTQQVIAETPQSRVALEQRDTLWATRTRKRMLGHKPVDTVKHLRHAGSSKNTRRAEATLTLKIGAQLWMKKRTNHKQNTTSLARVISMAVALAECKFASPAWPQRKKQWKYNSCMWRRSRSPTKNRDDATSAVLGQGVGHAPRCGTRLDRCLKLRIRRSCSAMELYSQRAVLHCFRDGVW